MSKVWITRTLPGAENTAMRLRAAGHEPLIAPLLNILPPVVAPPQLPQDAILCITSRNSVQKLVERTEDRHWPIVTVGDSTAELAQQLGFLDVQSASGTSEDVIDLVKSRFAGDQRPVIHISGFHIRGNIAGSLEAAGFTTRRDVYYKTSPVTSLPNVSIASLTHIFLHSPLAAHTLSTLATDLSHITAISISRDADVKLDALSLKQRLVADKPTENALLRLLD